MLLFVMDICLGFYIALIGLRSARPETLFTRLGFTKTASIHCSDSTTLANQLTWSVWRQIHYLTQKLMVIMSYKYLTQCDVLNVPAQGQVFYS